MGKGRRQRWDVRERDTIGANRNKVTGGREREKEREKGGGGRESKSGRGRDLTSAGVSLYKN